MRHPWKSHPLSMIGVFFSSKDSRTAADPNLDDRLTETRHTEPRKPFYYQYSVISTLTQLQSGDTEEMQ